MTGRMEGERKKFNKVEKDLENCPAYVNEWVINMKASELTAATIYDYLKKIKMFLSSIDSDIKNVTTDEINANSVTSFYLSRKMKDDDTEMSDSYRITLWYALNNFLKFLHKRGYISDNYIQDIRKPKNNDLARINKHRITLTEEDFKEIMFAAKCGVGSSRARARQFDWRERDICILLLYMVTGMRNTALCQINIEDIDFDKQRLVVRDKGRKTHQYVLTDHAMLCIYMWMKKREKLMEGYQDIDALFISDRRERITSRSAERIVKKYTKSVLGKGISPHKLRSGFCTILYKKTKDIVLVANAVGHSSVQTTQRYIASAEEDRQKAAELMDAVVDW